MRARARCSVVDKTLKPCAPNAQEAAQRRLAAFCRLRDFPAPDTGGDRSVSAQAGQTRFAASSCLHNA